MIRKYFKQTFAAILVSIAVFIAAGISTAEDEKAPDPQSPEFPTYVMAKIDDLYRGLRSHGTMEMNVKTRHWERSMTLESWSLGRDYSLVRILKPKKEKGSATLKAKDDLFMYLNKTGRTIKITSGMMGGSWMGSHFTNDDLVRHTRFSEDFKIKLSFQGDRDGQKVYVFTLIPNPDSPVVWGRVDVTVRQSDLQPLSQLFYDEDGKKVRILESSNHTEIDGRMMPMKMVMRPLDGSGEYTEVLWKEIKFNINLSQSFFTLQKLRSL